jgi:hypothetical protein
MESYQNRKEQNGILDGVHNGSSEKEWYLKEVTMR